MRRRIMAHNTGHRDRRIKIRTYKTSHSQENMNKSHTPLYVGNLILTCGILFFSLQMQAQKSDTRLSFSIRNASLEEFIKYLENSTGFSFIYGEEVKINRRITLEVKQKTIREILDQAFENEPVGYQIAGRHIPCTSSQITNRIVNSFQVVRLAFYPEQYQFGNISILPYFAIIIAKRVR